LFLLKVAVKKNEGRGVRFLHAVDVLDDCGADQQHKFSGQKYRKANIPEDALSCASYERGENISPSGSIGVSHKLTFPPDPKKRTLLRPFPF
jgi:hypothetical protein